jgi:hypothetical protein
MAFAPVLAVCTVGGCGDVARNAIQRAPPKSAAPVMTTRADLRRGKGGPSSSAISSSLVWGMVIELAAAAIVGLVLSGST